MNFMRTEFSINRLSLAFFILSFITCIYSVCDDSFNKTIRKEIEENSKNKDLRPQLLPGNDGIITVSNVDSTSLVLSWSPAELKGNINQQIQYAVYVSETNTLNNPDIASKQEPKYDGTGTKTPINGLLPGTLYYLNVLAYVHPHSCVYTTISVTTPPLTPAGLLPGNGGVISISKISSTEVTLEWAQAVIEKEAGQTIHYTVYSSGENNINTVNSIKNGISVNEGDNLLKLDIKDLNPDSTYYFNILASVASVDYMKSADIIDTYECVYTTVSLTTPPKPAPALVPGDSGTIIVSNIRNGGITLNWTKATLPVSNSYNNAILRSIMAEEQEKKIEYIVYLSKSNTINTPEGIKKNGKDKYRGFDIDTADIDHLPQGIYYFNISASNGELKCIYTTVSVSIETGKIYLFSDGVEINGNLGGRGGADKICSDVYENSFRLSLGKLRELKVRALISINNDDSIANMPRKYDVPDYLPIFSPGDISIGNNWDDLLDGAILHSLADANVTPPGTTLKSWWSGSSENGSFDTDENNIDNCGNWTKIDDQNTARQGRVKDENGKNWLKGNKTSCNSKGAVLCIGW